MNLSVITKIHAAHLEIEFLTIDFLAIWPLNGHVASVGVNAEIFFKIFSDFAIRVKS